MKTLHLFKVWIFLMCMVQNCTIYFQKLGPHFYSSFTYLTIHNGLLVWKYWVFLRLLL